MSWFFFFDTDENEYYFFFSLSLSLVSYVRVYTYVLGWEAAVGQGSPPPFFLGIAIGLLIRIKL